MAGAAGLEPVTSAVTGQRSNQLSYAPAMGTENVWKTRPGVKRSKKLNVRATDAKEVGVGNPAEETYCHPNTKRLRRRVRFVNSGFRAKTAQTLAGYGVANRCSTF